MQTFLVGGAVRDELLGVIPKDKDYVIVGATQEDIQNLIASGYSKVGADFPVYLHPTTNEEYALARIERKTGRGYLGFEVDTQGVSLKDDCKRRDITINSMAKDLSTNEIIDYYGGINDLKNKIIRHTSDAFIEDPLRIIRVCRFAARYDFDIHESTVELCKKFRYRLNEISKERIFLEMMKACSTTNHQKFFILLDALGISEVLFGSSQFGYTSTAKFRNHKILRLPSEIILASYFIKFKNTSSFFTNTRTITTLKNDHKFNNKVYSILNNYLRFINFVDTYKNRENTLLNSSSLLFDLYSTISKDNIHLLMVLYIHGRNSYEYNLYKLMKKIHLEFNNINWNIILFNNKIPLYDNNELPKIVKSYKLCTIQRLIS